MNNKKTYSLEYANFDFPEDIPVICLTGEIGILPDDEITFLHCHNCLEIGFCHQGEGDLIVENKLYRFHQNDVTVVTPNTMHKSKSSKGSKSIWSYIYIDVEKLLRNWAPERLSNLELLSFNSPDFPNVISEQENSGLQFLMQQLFHELKEHEEHWKLNVACLSISVIISILRLIPDNLDESNRNEKGKLIIYPAIQYVEENYMKPIHIEELSGICHFSQTHFRRRFQEIMKESPLAYVDRVRVNKSCELLYNTEQSLLEIALQTGFSGVKSYSRNFKKVFGMTPLQWRKNARFNIRHHITNSFRNRTGSIGAE